MNNEKGKNILLGVLIVGLVAMTVAYAALQTTLKIGNNDTQVTVQGGTWDVHFSGGTTGTTGAGASFVGTPSLTNTLISGIVVDFDNITTASNGAATATYTFNIVNGGSIDAKLSSITGGDVNCNENAWCTSNITATLKYTTAGSITGTTATVGSAVANNDVIKAGDTVGVTLTVAIPAVGNQQGDVALPTSDVTAAISDYVLLFVQN